MKEIKRDRYLKQLIESRQNGFIKIVTGIRRCGKSYLLLRNASQAKELFDKSLHVFVNHAEAEVEKHALWLSRITPAQLDNYRQA